MVDTPAIAGRIVGRYSIERELGRGGMAVVYLAYDPQHDRRVALKVLRPEVASAVGVERFLQEIRFGSSLQHPNILSLHDSGTLDGLPYYVMPFVSGESLRLRIERERQLPVKDSLLVAIQIGKALSYAHRQGIVHRDIKPENVLLSGPDAQVADFGIARAIAVAGTERLTETGLAVGTPAYMSPEQCGGSHIDGRSDLYALGCLLYEMLAGEPPFSGRTAQSIIARHMQDRPPSLSVVRPTVPAHVVHAIETALAKVPADRFQTAEEFIEALEATEDTTRTPTNRAFRRTWLQGAFLAGGLAATIAALIGLLGPQSRALDANRVMVFPLRDSRQAADRGAGEDVATYIGHVLDGSDPLRWEEGRDWLDPEQRLNPGRLGASDARTIARNRGAGFYIDGSIVREADSIVVILRLFDVARDSLIKRVGRSGGSSVPAAQLGALAVGDLLPALLGARRTGDIGALRERRPVAIANFLQGERAYREGRFRAALEHYESAVQDDSMFALAAVKGAFAAVWAEELEQVPRLAGVAVRADSALPLRYASFARGLRHYVLGSADSAVAELRTAVSLASDWEEAWMALGEVYHHLLPRVANLDSLAEDAFRHARKLDGSFTPPLYHLFEKSVRAGRLIEASWLLDSLNAVPLDSAFGRVAKLMLRCARGGMGERDWVSAAATAPRDVLDAARPLSSAVTFRRCAEVGLSAVLGSDSATPAYRFNALFNLQSLLVQQRRYREVRELLHSPVAAPLGGPFFLLNDALADSTFEDDAREIARQQGQDYGSMSSVKLWLLGTWEARYGRRQALVEIEKTLWFKADSSGQARDSLLANIVSAHAAVASGDTSLALERLEALKPTGPGQDITWSLWSSMGLERLTQARLLMARSRYADALKVAEVLDSPQPTLYLLYAAPSLALRARAADALGDSRMAQEFRTRYAALANTRT